MNIKAVSIPTYLAAVASVAVLALGAVALSALFAHASTGPTVTVNATNGSNAVVASAPIGTTITAGAVVASSTSSAVPTGTVNFSTFNNLACSGTPTVQSGVALVNGMASSSAAAMSNAGLSYLVNYNGDANNTPSVSSCVSVTPTSQVVVITPSLSASSVNQGSSITAGAMLGGITASATGTVSYTFYTNNICTTATTSPASVTVTNGTVPASAPVTFNQPGTYYLQEVYSGDQFNSGVTSTCGAQVLTVNAINTTPTTGTITVDEVTTPSASSTNFQFNTTGSNYAGFALTDTAAPNVQTLVPGTYSVTQPAIAGWTLSSATCSVNGATATAYTPGAAIDLAAGQNVSCVFNDTAVSAPTPVAGAAGTISGTVFNDTNKNRKLDAGEAGIAGVTIKLSVLQNNWWQNLTGAQKYTEVTTTVSDGNGNYSFNNLPAGVYFVEEIKTPGVNQISNDFRPVPLLSSQGDAGLNFANITKTPTTTPPVAGKGHGRCDGDNDADDVGCTATTASTTSQGHGDNFGRGNVKGLLQKVIPAIHAEIESHSGRDNNDR